MPSIGLFDSRFLNSVRLKTIITTLASELERNRPLIYLKRTPIVNAEDDEIMGRFTGRVIAADIIADDQAARVVESGKVEISTTQIPNVKLGQRIGQAKLNLMERLKQGATRPAEEDALLEWEQTFGETLLLGLRQRMNAMICAMMLDSYNYNRWGVDITGATWGMPANLKVTTAQAWSNDGVNPNVAATPIDDIFSLDQVYADNYGGLGGMFDRVTMSSKTFRFMIATTQFANLASIPLSTHFLAGPSAISQKDMAWTRTIAGQILNKELEIDDATYQEVANDGTVSTTRTMPSNKVLLSRKQDDNDQRVMDWGNGIVTESIVGSVMGESIFGMQGAEYGPLAYYTPTDARLNPPGVIGWAVARGFPRKMLPEATAVLTVGSYS